MSAELANRVVLITGASTGLGKAMAIHLGRQGARVALNYCNSNERAQEAFTEFREAGGEGLLVQADATNEAAVAQMVAETEKALGPVDSLVVNATCDQPQRPIEEYDWAFYQSMIDFFLKSPYLLTRACLAGMKERRFGRIVNIGSEVYDRGVPNFSAYVAAKGGQRGWTKSLAMELAPWSITVNMVSPGWIPVERHDTDPQQQRNQDYSKDSAHGLLTASLLQATFDRAIQCLQ